MLSRRIPVLLILILAFPVVDARAQDPAGEDVRYASGDLTLAALLLVPDSAGPHPAAVILQGSGTSDRTNAWARAIADELVEAGLVVLLTDKRGSGASEGDWRTADFDDLAADALAGLAFLRSRPEVDAKRIGLVGLSQGGWVAPVAASRAEDIAFVIDVSGAAVTFSEQTFAEMANTARQAGLSPEGVQGVIDLNRATAGYLTTGNWEAYEEARTRALDTEWGEIASGFPAERELPIWTFLRGVADFDPLPYWNQVTAPVLVLYGEEDESDNVPVAESVRRLEFAFGAAGKENYEIVVIPGAGHAFIDPVAQELMPEFVDALTEWVRSATRPPD